MAEPDAPSRRAFLGGTAPPAFGNADCVLTPQITQGPYFLDPKLVRRDIREGKPGVPMRVRLRVVDVSRCAPIANARLDVWQADARGVYSGYHGQGDTGDADTTGQTYLRGAQGTDADGWAEFDTIYPGWYSGRNPHFHFKAFVGDRNVLIGEMHFPDALSEFIYANAAAYAHRMSDRAVININDAITTRADPHHLTSCAIREDRDRYVASFVIGVDRGFDAVAAGREEAAHRPPGGFPDLPPDLAGPPALALRDRLAGLIPGLHRG